MRATALLVALAACGTGTESAPSRTLMTVNDLWFPAYVYLFDANTNTGRRLGTLAAGDSLCSTFLSTDSLVFLAATAAPPGDTTTFLSSVNLVFWADSAAAWNAHLTTVSGFIQFDMTPSARCRF